MLVYSNLNNKISKMLRTVSVEYNARRDRGYYAFSENRPPPLILRENHGLVEQQAHDIRQARLAALKE